MPIAMPLLSRIRFSCSLPLDFAQKQPHMSHNQGEEIMSVWKSNVITKRKVVK